MPTAVIIGIIGLSLFIMVALAISMQTLEKNRKEKQQLERNLQARIRNFEYMLNGLPEGFLSRDLQILVCKCLQEVYQQLTNLKPKNSQYASSSIELEDKISQLRKQSSKLNKIELTDPQQIKEVQKILKSLFNFISKLSENGRINNKDAQVYASQIKQLMLQTTLDSLNKSIKDAINAGKFKLAIHNIKMAMNKIEKENKSGNYENQLENYKKKVSELTSLQANNDTQAVERRKQHNAEWDEANKPDESWKKKALYD
jgi:hypothetical protein